METKESKEFRVENYPLSLDLYNRYYENANPCTCNSTVYIKFLDSQNLIINVYSDPDGIDWFIDLSGIPIAESESRQDAERIGIIEAFETLEQILKG